MGAALDTVTYDQWVRNLQMQDREIELSKQKPSVSAQGIMDQTVLNGP